MDALLDSSTLPVTLYMISLKEYIRSAENYMCIYVYVSIYTCIYLYIYIRMYEIRLFFSIKEVKFIIISYL